MFPSHIYSQRRQHLTSIMKSGIGIFLGNDESPMNYPANPYHFRQDSSFLYFFGLDVPGLAALIDFETGESIIYGNDFDVDDIIWMGPQPLIKDLAQQCDVQKTFSLSQLETHVKTFVSQGRKVHYLPPYRHANMLWLENLLGIPALQTKSQASIELIKAVVALREIKDELEIAEIEKACNTGFLMHTTAMKMARVGVCEQEIAGTIEGIALAHGASVSFPVILSRNGETLHNHYHGNILQQGDLMIVDAGCESSLHYASDFTRIVPVGGKFSPVQKSIYEIVEAANNQATELIKPGIKYKDVHLHACHVIAKGLKEIGLMQGNVEEAVAAGAHALFFPHGLGHMMGLDVHDMEDLGQIYVGYDDETRPSDQFGTAYLRLGKTLKQGFVLTVEPGIYFIPALIDQWKAENKHSAFINYSEVEKFRSFGGIRLEDDVLVTTDGYKRLGKKRIPISVTEVESFMRL